MLTHAQLFHQGFERRVILVKTLIEGQSLAFWLSTVIKVKTPVEVWIRRDTFGWSWSVNSLRTLINRYFCIEAHWVLFQEWGSWRGMASHFSKDSHDWLFQEGGTWMVILLMFLRIVIWRLIYRPTCLVYCLTFYMMLLMLILVRTIMHSHGDSIEYGHFWMVILVRVLIVSHFSMEAHWGLL